MSEYMMLSVVSASVVYMILMLLVCGCLRNRVADRVEAEKMMRNGSFLLLQILLFVILGVFTIWWSIWLFQLIWESDLPMWAKWMLLK